MKPFVSVVIPVYNNRRDFLREAIGSALGQTYRDREVIVVDDGSTTDMEWVGSAYEGRVRYVRKENRGPASARNLGITLSRGEYVAFLDADDVWEPDKVETQVRLLTQEAAAGLVYSAVVRITDQGERMGRSANDRFRRSGRVFQDLFMRNFIPTSTVMVRRSGLDAVGLFDEAPELISVEDYDLWLRLAERYAVAYVDRPLVRYRLHGAGISRTTARSYLGEQRVIERAVARYGDRYPELRGRLRRRFGRLFFEYGWAELSRDRCRAARAQFLKSLRYVPADVRVWGYLLAASLGGRAVLGLRQAKRRLARGGVGSRWPMAVR